MNFECTENQYLMIFVSRRYSVVIPVDQYNSVVTHVSVILCNIWSICRCWRVVLERSCCVVRSETVTNSHVMRCLYVYICCYGSHLRVDTARWLLRPQFLLCLISQSVKFNFFSGRDVAHNTLCSGKNTHSHFLSYLHEWWRVDLDKNCSEYTQGTVDSDNVEIRYLLRPTTLLWRHICMAKVKVSL